jgi:nicotinamide-nucleotide amidase
MEDLAQKIGRRLKASRQRLVTAESCTGGWAAQVVTSVAGSSEWFERGFVTYSNDAKHELLGVPAEMLKKFGAVSEETAREMALGALARSKGTIALSVTGVAGPTGGSAAKPVGTVCFAWATKGSARGAKGSARGAEAVARSETRHFEGDRESVRRQSVIRALEGVIELLDSA